jgi:hypothetical protein
MIRTIMFMTVLGFVVPMVAVAQAEGEEPSPDPASDDPGQKPQDEEMHDCDVPMICYPRCIFIVHVGGVPLIDYDEHCLFPVFLLNWPECSPVNDDQDFPFLDLDCLDPMIP